MKEANIGGVCCLTHQVPPNKDKIKSQFINDLNTNYMKLAWVPALSLIASLLLFALSSLLYIFGVSGISTNYNSFGHISKNGMEEEASNYFVTKFIKIKL